MSTKEEIKAVITNYQKCLEEAKIKLDIIESEENITRILNSDVQKDIVSLFDSYLVKTLSSQGEHFYEILLKIFDKIQDKNYSVQYPCYTDPIIYCSRNGAPLKLLKLLYEHGAIMNNVDFSRRSCLSTNENKVEILSFYINLGIHKDERVSKTISSSTALLINLIEINQELKKENEELKSKTISKETADILKENEELKTKINALKQVII